MQKIVPNLWFDREAKDAVEFYTNIFPNSEILSTTVLHNTPSGDTDIISYKLWDYQFLAMNAGDTFKLNPSISFMVNFDPSVDHDSRAHLDEMWGKLIDGGKALMPLEEYPFSPHYGWVEDKFGVTWQLILTNPDGEKRPPIIPSMMSIGDNAGKAQEATDFYLKVFKDAKRGAINFYPKGMEPDKEGSVMFTDFTLEGQWFAAIDSAQKHDFSLNEAISLIVNCTDQAEIDYYWESLSAVPESEQCGWLKDKYGVSWQITPIDMEKMLSEGTRDQIDRVTQAFLPMKKIDLKTLKQAYIGS